ncbi:hairy and enhancer of split-related protein HELT isoform X3 [Agelaius phoeniceus]|uniref:hairy and enhancer of split-related protein HELT isoform X3 n=1 Tax=Agelaius phoeniceus TaxID=39638 RepID=UPI004054ADE9
MASKLKERRRTPVSHKVIEKRRRDRINRCLTELGKTVPMALAKQSSGKLEKAEILEMTVQYLRALHSADFPRGREKAELLSEFANYFHYGYHECMKNLVHYLTTVERMETKDTKGWTATTSTSSAIPTPTRSGCPRASTPPCYRDSSRLKEHLFMTADTAGTRAHGEAAGGREMRRGPGWREGAPGGPDLPPPALSEGLKLPPLVRLPTSGSSACTSDALE